MPKETLLKISERVDPRTYIPASIKDEIRRQQKEITRHIDEESSIVADMLRWLLLAALVGATVGIITTVFLHALNHSIAYTAQHPFIYYFLPIALVINILFVMYVFPNTGTPSTDSVIKDIHERRPISPAVILKAFIAPIITIASGGSVGKEAPAADMGASLGTLIGKLLRFNTEDMRKLAICGISAGFASIFGTPIAGAIFGIEVLFVGSIMYEVILPSFVAGIIGYEIAASLGAPFWYYPITITPEFTALFFLKVVLAGILFGLCAFMLIELIKLARYAASLTKFSKTMLAFFGGALLVILAAATSTQYLGLGIETIEQTVHGTSPDTFAFLYKSIFTAITLAAGGAGGLVTPTLFVGATAGSTIATILHADLGTFAAIGMVAVLAGAASTPIAASILAMELFGPTIAPYAALACIISFIVTGHRSIYPSQVTMIRKTAAGKIHLLEAAKSLPLWKWRSRQKKPES